MNFEDSKWVRLNGNCSQPARDLYFFISAPVIAFLKYCIDCPGGEVAIGYLSEDCPLKISNKITIPYFLKC
jgi:hypothetical protein